jgi:hypothetical protein
MTGTNRSTQGGDRTLNLEERCALNAVCIPFHHLGEIYYDTTCG